MTMKLIGYKKIKGQIKLVTGLHIGGSKEEIRIGECDNPVIRNPIDDYPYIPGSSLKGKIRSLLEWKLGAVAKDGSVHKCNESDCPICRIFGTANQENFSGPTRIIFRDCNMSKDSKKELENLKLEKGMYYTEEKYENVINRRTGTVNRGGLRQVERVPAGTIFEFELVFRVFEMNEDKGKKDEEFFEVVKSGLKLLEEDYLGGSGSRGYGKIEFVELKNENNEEIKLPELEKINQTQENIGLKNN